MTEASIDPDNELGIIAISPTLGLPHLPGGVPISKFASYCDGKPFRFRRSLSTMDNLVENGHLALIEAIHESGFSYCQPEALDKCVEYGHISTLEWVFEHHGNLFTDKALDKAAGSGQLHTLEWLHRTAIGICSEKAIEEAAKNGHLFVVEWLVSTMPEISNSGWAYDNALGQGHIAVFKFLNSRKPIPRLRGAFSQAIRSQNMELLRWIKENRPMDVRGRVYHIAPQSAGMGHLGVIEWLYANAIDDSAAEGLHPAMMTEAAIHGQLEVMEWLLRRRPDGGGGGGDDGGVFSPRSRGRLALRAAARGHVRAAEWLWGRGPPPAAAELDLRRAGLCHAAAAEDGHAAGLRWFAGLFRGLGLQPPAGPAAEAAAANGHLEALRYLLDHPPEEAAAPGESPPPPPPPPLWPPAHTLEAMLAQAVANGHLPVVELLETRYGGRWAAPAAVLDVACGAGYLHILEWWARHRREEGPSLLGCRRALEEGFLDTVRFLDRALPGVPWVLTPAACSEHVLRGRFEVVEWVHRKQGMEFFDPHLTAVAAAKVGDIVALDYCWRASSKSKPTVAVRLPQVVRAGLRFPCVLHWAAARSGGALAGALAPAGHAQAPLAQRQLMLAAARTGRVDVVAYLHAQGFACTEESFLEAARAGHYALFRWQHDRALREVLVEARRTHEARHGRLAHGDGGGAASADRAPRRGDGKEGAGGGGGSRAVGAAALVFSSSPWAAALYRLLGRVIDEVEGQPYHWAHRPLLQYLDTETSLRHHACVLQSLACCLSPSSAAASSFHSSHHSS